MFHVRNVRTALVSFAMALGFFSFTQAQGALQHPGKGGGAELSQVAQKMDPAVVADFENARAVGRDARVRVVIELKTEDVDTKFATATAPDRIAAAVPDQEVKNSTGANLDRVIRRARLHWDDGGARQVVDRTIQAGRRRLGR